MIVLSNDFNTKLQDEKMIFNCKLASVEVFIILAGDNNYFKL